MKAKLIEQRAYGDEFEIDSEKKTYIVGRSPQADLQIQKNTKGISRLHAVISYCPSSEEWIIYDWDSTNGTKIKTKESVDAYKIRKERNFCDERTEKMLKNLGVEGEWIRISKNLGTQLRSGDIIGLGQKYQLQFIDENLKLNQKDGELEKKLK
jgi:pSer/pThr/pTyr-binding forkhead associated (FHA) protein